MAIKRNNILATASDANAPDAETAATATPVKPAATRLPSAPRKRKTATIPSEPVVVEEPEPEPEPEFVSEPEPVSEPADEPADAAAENKVATKAPVSLDDVLSIINESVSSLREEAQNAKLRKDKQTAAVFSTLIKNLNGIRRPIDKLARSKPVRKTARSGGGEEGAKNTNNALMKPVQISAEMAAFLGTDPSELKSRVNITTALCEYIRDHNLQNPLNRREILVDATLQRLLNYDPVHEPNPLTYYMLQSRIQPHFIQTTTPLVL